MQLLLRAPKLDTFSAPSLAARFVHAWSCFDSLRSMAQNQCPAHRLCHACWGASVLLPQKFLITSCRNTGCNNGIQPCLQQGGPLMCMSSAGSSCLTARVRNKASWDVRIHGSVSTCSESFASRHVARTYVCQCRECAS